MQESFIYHELQESMLCGVHCLNNLLQRVTFSPFDLAAYADEMHETERVFMMENGCETREALQFIAQDNQNVDEYGNFSIQVLKTALDRRHGIQLVVWSTKTEAARDICEYEGFICNRNDHWFAIRKIGENYWNLNSCNKKPKKITPFYLTAFLGQLTTDGYSVFVADGALPQPLSEPMTELSKTQKCYSLSSLLSSDKGSSSNPSVTSKIGEIVNGFKGILRSAPATTIRDSELVMDDDNDMKVAMALSMSDVNVDTSFSFILSAVNSPDLSNAYDEIFARDQVQSTSVDVISLSIELKDGFIVPSDFPATFSLLALYVFVDVQLKENTTNGDNARFQLLSRHRILGESWSDLKNATLGSLRIASDSFVSVKIVG